MIGFFSLQISISDANLIKAQRQAPLLNVMGELIEIGGVIHG